VTYTWDYTEDGERDKGSESDEEYNLNLKFTENSIIAYSYYDEDDCYDSYANEYSLSGNRLIGEDFEGEETVGDETESWYTEITKNGNKLVITLVENYSSTNENGWGKDIITLKRYDGEIPPKDWPNDRCTYKKQVKRFFTAKRK